MTQYCLYLTSTAVPPRPVFIHFRLFPPPSYTLPIVVCVTCPSQTRRRPALVTLLVERELLQALLRRSLPRQGGMRET
ncbi:hypothetical protein VTK26DRAFT_4983 [Humicola hyalothermophila]